MNRLAVICNLQYPVLWTFLSGLFVLGVLSLSASEPRFTGIDLLSPKLLVVHFDTEPNRTYIVQVSSGGASNASPVVWRDFFVAPAFPFANHYVVAEKPGFTMSLQALLSYDEMAPDRVFSHDVSSTGMRAWYLGPDIRVTVVEHASISAGVDLPISVDNRGLQNVQDFRLHGGLSWKF